MNAITWKPGTDALYDPLFDHLREKHFRDHSHPLWQNYNRKHFFEECLALTIAFNEHGFPILCSSVLARDCWPNNTFRILNRLWAVFPTERPIKDLHPAGGPLLRSQIEWIKDNFTCDMVFISRESYNWQKWTIEQYKRLYQLDFEHDNYYYLTCNDPLDNSCCQKIIYQGDKTLLTDWKRHC